MNKYYPAKSRCFGGRLFFAADLTSAAQKITAGKQFFILHHAGDFGSVETFVGESIFAPTRV